MTTSDRLAQAARRIFDCQSAGGPEYLEWETHYEELLCALDAYDAAKAVREAEREVLDYAMSRPTLNFTFESLKHALLAARKALEVKP